jgi:hypothetical protein
MSPGQRPTEADKKLLRLALQSVPSRSVIPTVAKRSGGICSSTDLSWKCFSTGGVLASAPPKRIKICFN